MIIKALKNKNFLFVWLVLSCIGGVISYTLIQRRDNNLRNGKVAYVREFRKEFKRSTIIQ
jgi:hypothetical protein